MIDTLRQREDDNYIDRDMIYTEDEYNELKEKLEEAENRIEDLEDKLNQIKELIVGDSDNYYGDELEDEYKQLLNIIKGE